MPNNTFNRLYITGEPDQVQKVIDDVVVDGCIDFDKIIPCPEPLMAYDNCPAYNDAAKDYIRSGEIPEQSGNKSFNDQDKQQIMRVASNMIKYGYFSWYDWCIEHWDTKWNAYRDCCCYTIQLTNYNLCAIVEFHTAWVPPLKVINALRLLYPNVKIFHQVVNEEQLQESLEHFVQYGEDIIKDADDRLYSIMNNIVKFGTMISQLMINNIANSQLSGTATFDEIQIGDPKLSVSCLKRWMYIQALVDQLEDLNNQLGRFLEQNDLDDPEDFCTCIDNCITNIRQFIGHVVDYNCGEE